jgi:hypothetical protein
MVQMGFIYHKIDLSDLGEPYLSAVKTSLENDEAPNGREAYMREFEQKFETSVNNMKLGADIDRSPNPWWKNGQSDT